MPLEVSALQDLMSDEERRIAAAARVRVAADFDMPKLRYWNYDLCRKHRAGWVMQKSTGRPLAVTQLSDEVRDRAEASGLVETIKPAPGCRDCGIHFRKHQRVGIAWLYLNKRCLLADTVGSGKTAHAAGLLAIMKETGELERGRVVICVRSPALLQWSRELHRMMPALHTTVAMGTRKERVERYMSGWDVTLIGPQMLLNDYEMLLRFPLKGLIIDDVDALRHADNRTSYVLKRIARETERCVIMTGTPLQKKLPELHSVLEPLGGRDVFGPEASFVRRYVRKEKVTVYVKGKKREVDKIVGYKNLDEFKRLIAPMALRRTASDIDDVDLPAIIASDVKGDLYPAQRAKYEELKRGVLTILKEHGTEVKQAQALASLHYGAQICGGLASLGEEDGPQRSWKLDWIMEKLDGDLENEKVVIFCAYKNTIRALQNRLDAAGIGHETVWGEEPDKLARDRSQERFWKDPRCRVLMGTQAIEQSLNLQVSRHLINVDMILNPARMEQLAGRIRRDGSAFKHVYVHNLLTNDTQEERYLPLLEREQALIDHVWDENSELFEALNPIALMQLILPSRERLAA